MHDNMKAQICVNGELLGSILLETRLKQADLLVPTLIAIFFAMVFLRAFKNIEVGISVRYRTTGNLSNFRRFDTVTKTFISFISDLL